MELFANDLSIHKQFHDIPSFRGALQGLMAMRKMAERFSRELYCHRAFLNAEPLHGMPMRQALGRLDKDEQRAAASWLTRNGPFWDDERRHSRDDWLECREEVVTDSAVGEAAYRKLHSVEAGLISLAQTNWNFSPVEVISDPPANSGKRGSGQVSFIFFKVAHSSGDASPSGSSRCWLMWPGFP